MDSIPKAQENVVAAVATAEMPLDGSYPGAQVMAQLSESARRLSPPLWHGGVVISPLNVVDDDDAATGTVCGGRLVGMSQSFGAQCSDGKVSTLD
jgi:hypothetical protein